MNSDLKRNVDWNIIDGLLCKVIEFIPIALIRNGKIHAANKAEPYASVILMCENGPNAIKAGICHKMDFQHLWAAIIVRGVHENEEVLICHRRKSLKKYAKLFSVFMPKLFVMLCPKGAFDLLTDPKIRPDLQGEARFLAMKPIMQWKPEVLE
jgi:hypothetical protein